MWHEVGGSEALVDVRTLHLERAEDIAVSMVAGIDKTVVETHLCCCRHRRKQER